jgi:hypothetical protein
VRTIEAHNNAPAEYDHLSSEKSAFLIHKHVCM